MQDQDVKYAGFWIRFFASMIDSILLMIVLMPIFLLMFGAEYFTTGEMEASNGVANIISWFLPAIVVILFWMHKKATPGKMICKLQVIDAQTGANLTLKQSIIRYVGYIISSIPLCLGFIWAAFDSKKQGWHDKLAKSVVIHAQKDVAPGTQPGTW